MRTLLISALVLLLASTMAMAQDSTTVMPRTPDQDQYRRSSLCMILLTHGDKKYAAEMERVFRSMPMPPRYNNHNISELRVISVRGKQTLYDIMGIVRNHHIAQRVVSQWFNRQPVSGAMDMDLIHDRGGYGASWADYERASNTVRGVSSLRDEGIELLQSTFVLVCDLDYIDRAKGARWGAFGLSLLSGALQLVAAADQAEANRARAQGNYSRARKKENQAAAYGAGSLLGYAGAAVVGDIGGFRVKMSAYLFKLQWDNSTTQYLYNNCWVDSSTLPAEAARRRDLYEKYDFKIDFIGQYKTTSSKTILRSWSNEDEVILDVCSRCVKKGIAELARKFPVFRPRSPFYFDGATMYSRIGRKEEVTYGRKYEVLQPYKDKKGQIQYKRVGTVTATKPWANTDIRFDEYFDPSQKGTAFIYKSSKVDLHTPGLQLREMK